MKTILITGCAGMLGSYMMDYYKHDYNVFGTDINIDDTIYTFNSDVADIDKMEEIFKKVKPDIVIHCAAIISPEDCEKYQNKAYDVNVHGTRVISFLCKVHKSKLIYISTNMVFEGNRNKAYEETDKTKPINFYGVTKEFGERCALSSNNSLVIRTNILGWKTGSFGEWLYSSILNNKTLNMYKNLYFNCLFVGDLCKYLDPLMNSELSGIYHLTSRDYMSKYQHALLIKGMFKKNKTKINKVKYKAKENVVKRPFNAVLDCSKYENEFEIVLPTMLETTKRFIYEEPNYYPYSDNMR